VAQRYENKCRFSTVALLFTVTNTRITANTNNNDTSILDTNRIASGINAFIDKYKSITNGRKIPKKSNDLINSLYCKTTICSNPNIKAITLRKTYFIRINKKIPTAYTPIFVVISASETGNKRLNSRIC
jgi:hypothetical protein